jgi:hypothetical protein
VAALSATPTANEIASWRGLQIARERVKVAAQEGIHSEDSDEPAEVEAALVAAGPVVRSNGVVL